MLDKRVEFLVEQKLNELLGDPDSFFGLKKDFLRRLKARLSRSGKTVAHSQVLKKYGLN